MILTIELPDALAGPLNAEASAQGLSTDRYDCGIVERALSSQSIEHPEVVDGAVKPVWEMMLDRIRDAPPGAFDGLPRDGAAEHDHYIYGTPKKYS